MQKKNVLKTVVLSLVAVGVLAAQGASTARHSSTNGWPVWCPVCYNPDAPQQPGR